MDIFMQYVLPAIVTGSFALIGTVVGIVRSTKLTTYRINSLEEKVDKLGNFGERLVILEQRYAFVKEDIDDVKQIIETINC